MNILKFSAAMLLSTNVFAGDISDKDGLTSFSRSADYDSDSSSECEDVSEHNEVVTGNSAEVVFRKPCRFDGQVSNIILSQSGIKNVGITVKSVRDEGNGYFVRIISGDSETSAEALLKNSDHEHGILHISLDNSKPIFAGAI